MRALRSLSVLASLTVATLAAGPVPSLPSLRATLDRASSPALLRTACARLATSLSDVTAIGRTPERDASFASIARFVRSRRSVDQRAWCLKNARTLSTLSAPASGASALDAHAGPYSGDIESLQVALFGAPRESDRLVAAIGSRTDARPPVGRLLLAAAARDSSPRVRAAALHALNWPMHADIRAGASRSRYDRVIRRALADPDPAIVVAGLRAYVALHDLPQSDATLRRYARATNPRVRAGALQAYDTYPSADPGVRAFIETRLNDPDRAVRIAAIEEFAWVDDSHTRATLRRIIRGGRTAVERDEARAQLHALVAARAGSGS